MAADDRIRRLAERLGVSAEELRTLPTGVLTDSIERTVEMTLQAAEESAKSADEVGNDDPETAAFMRGQADDLRASARRTLGRLAALDAGQAH